MSSPYDASAMASPSALPPVARRGMMNGTRWSLILRATDPANPRVRQDLNELCTLYYPVVLDWIRRWLSEGGHRTDEAEDHCSGFFAKLVRLNKFAKANPELGKFRTYLWAMLTGYLKDALRYDHAQKRDVRLTVSHDSADEEEQALIELADTNTPDREFDRAFMRATLADTMAELEHEMQGKGKAKIFAALSASINKVDERLLCEVASTLGMTRHALAAEAKRLSKRWRELFRAAVGSTLPEPTEENISAEIAYLLSISREAPQGIEHRAA